MSPPNDTPLVARLARWSEWWFTPRWRALSTWLALTTIGVGLANDPWFFDMIGRPIVYMNRFLPAPLPLVFHNFARVSTVLLLVTWFEPLALRLSLRRGLAWIGLTFAAPILWSIAHSLSDLVSELAVFAIIVGIGALQCGVLRGWRSRPWMCLPARALTAALMLSGPLFSLGDIWWLNTAVVALPNAALLLYGTRILRPEERRTEERLIILNHDR